VILPDVNVLIGAFRRDSPQHDELAAWLEGAANGPETLGLTDPVLGGVVRVLTHPRVFAQPSSLDEIFGAIDRLRSADGVARVVPGPRHGEIFAGLCRAVDARGNLVADAQHVAVAIEHGATWVTLDHDFARFDGLRWRSPLDTR
jgi:hypothetical protein